MIRIYEICDSSLVFIMIIFILGIFVPYFIDKYSIEDRIDEGFLSYLIQTGKKIVALGISSKQEKVGIIPAAFRYLSHYYFEKSYFVILEENLAEEYSKNAKLSLPSLFLFDNGIGLGAFRYPTNEVSILFLINRFISHFSIPISSFSSLCSSLGNSPYALVHTFNSYNDVLNLHYQSSNQLGVCDLICIEPSVFVDIGMPDQQIALFRKEDNVFVPINNTLNSILQSTIPVYRNLGLFDLEEGEKPIFALIAPKFDAKMKDFLYEIGFKYPNFIVGFLPSRYYRYASSTTNKTYTGKHDIAIFNYQRNYFYNTENTFMKEFDSSLWIQKASSIIDDIIHYKILPQFVSEPDSKTIDSNVHKIVGSSYQYFVENPTIDTVVLYTKSDCLHCIKFFTLYSELAQLFCNSTNLQFGFIDIAKNSSPLPFPSIDGVPSIMFFPSNETVGYHHLGPMNKESLILFLSFYSSFPQSITLPHLDERMSLMVVQLIKKSLSKLDAYEVTKANLFIDYIQSNFKSSRESEFDEL